MKFLNKRKRAVSPVIAVVLLIALTLAAPPVVWSIVNENIQRGDHETIRLKRINSASVDNSANAMSVSLIINTDMQTSIVSATIVNSTHNSFATLNSISTSSLNKGDSAIMITFDTSSVVSS